jgi:hypothetical protein
VVELGRCDDVSLELEDGAAQKPLSQFHRVLVVRPAVPNAEQQHHSLGAGDENHPILLRRCDREGEGKAGAEILAN